MLYTHPMMETMESFHGDVFVELLEVIPVASSPLFDNNET